MLRTGALEAQARRAETKRRSAARNGGPQAYVDMGIPANFGIHLHADSTQKGAAKQGTSASTHIGLEEAILPEQTDQQQDSLLDYQG